MDLNDLVPILQGAIGPVILISGVGLLLLSMTNGFGRVLERSRQLAEALRTAPGPERPGLISQLEILYRRARLLRAAITLATVSVLTAAMLVIGLFLGALLRIEMGLFGASMFIVCMLSLIASLIIFLQDINQSLAAVKLELKATREEMEAMERAAAGPGARR